MVPEVGSKIIGQIKKNLLNKKSRNICPVFYKALINSEIDDWFVFTMNVCPKEDLKKWETELIKKYKTSDPKFGYNIFVGNNKPTNEQYLKKYQLEKATSNSKRANNGKMKRVEHNKNLPTYISYYPVKNNNKLVQEGYMARIKINGKIYKKIFISMEESLESKLEKAKKYIDLIKTETSKDNPNLDKLITTGAPRTIDKSKNLPTNIRYYISKDRNGKLSEGYSVEISIDKKKYKKVFTSMAKTMKYKLEKAKKQLEIFKSIGDKTNKVNLDLSTTKGPERKTEKGKNLPTNIRYYTSKNRNDKLSEGYLVGITINKKKYKKVFTSMAETMEFKLEKAKKQLQLFKKDANNKIKSGSKTNKKI